MQASGLQAIMDLTYAPNAVQQILGGKIHFRALNVHILGPECFTSGTNKMI